MGAPYTQRVGNFIFEHRVDLDGNPDGGFSRAAGVSVEWQRGPTVVDGVDHGQNGAFVQTVIAVAANRLEHYQATRFRCDENAEAIRLLNEAIAVLESRFQKRAARGVLGTHNE